MPIDAPSETAAEPEPQPRPESADATSSLVAGPITVQVGPQGHVTITVQPGAALSSPDVALESAADRGLGDLFGGGRQEGFVEANPFEDILNNLNLALQKLGNKIVAFADDVSTLEVRTYVSERIEEVRPDGANGFESAKQRALTYIEFDGDTQVVVPVDAGQIDEALWNIHLQTVGQAQAHRQAMLRTVGELVQGFIPVLK